jgi:DMSO reductase anchor subunit
LNTGQEGNIIYLCVAAGAISAIIMTWTIGMVYHLPGRFTWEEFPYSAAPLVTSFFLGSYWIIFFSEAGTWFELIFFILWLLDFLMALARAVTFRRLMKNQYRFEFPHLIPLTRTGHMTRLILSLVLIPVFLFTFSRTILFIIMVSILLDRLCFYAGTVGVSPKSEIAFQKAERMKQAV